MKGSPRRRRLEVVNTTDPVLTFPVRPAQLDHANMFRIVVGPVPVLAALGLGVVRFWTPGSDETATHS